MPEEFRSAVVRLDALAATVNEFAAAGFLFDLEWCFIDDGDTQYGHAPNPWVHVWAWRAEPEEPTPAPERAP